MTDELRPYKALVFPEGTDKVGHRVTALARDAAEARRMLEEQYGKGRVLNVYNEDDAARPR